MLISALAGKGFMQHIARRNEMYKCNCGALFREPDTANELVGECWGTPAYWHYDICPVCGSEEISEVNICRCGQTCDIGEKYCDDCKSELKWRLKSIMVDFNAEVSDLDAILEEENV